MEGNPLKKFLCLMLLCGLCAFVLSGCKRSGDGGQAPDAAKPGAPEATAVPEVGAHGEEDQSAALLEAMPTLEPVEPLDGPAVTSAGDGYFDIDALLNQPVGDAEATADGQAQPLEAPLSAPEAAAVATRPDTSGYQYTALTDTSLGFTFNYPSHWVSVPGVYTVCFREPPEEGHFPARVAITVKKMVHTPDEQVLEEQLTAYMRIIHKQYDSSTFESGTPNLSDNLMGRLAMSNTYLAFSGKNEVKGYVIGTAVGRNICVFHFCAAYEDYAALEGAMQYMLHSIQAVDNNG